MGFLGRCIPVISETNYFHTLAQAVQEAAQRTIRLMPGTCGPETLEALLSAISGLAQDITNALAGIDDAELRRAS